LSEESKEKLKKWGFDQIVEAAKFSNYLIVALRFVLPDFWA